MDFITMTNIVFNQNAKNVIDVLGKKLEAEEFKSEEDFLKKVSNVLEKRLNNLHIAELCFGNDFWFKRIVQLQENPIDKEYVQYIISLLVYMSQELLETNPSDLADLDEALLKEYTNVYLKEEFKEKNEYYDILYYE